MATTQDIRNGLCIEHENDIYSIVEFLHVKTARGPAFIRTKLKSMTTGKVIENTFNSGAKINEVRVERRKFQFLYKDESGFNFMNNETYDQISIQEELVDNPQFLMENMEVDILYNAGNDAILTLEMPSTVNLLVTYTEPGLKGDTATNTFKPATVQTGAEVRVPLFVNEGDLIKIDTRTGAYMERVKQ